VVQICQGRQNHPRTKGGGQQESDPHLLRLDVKLRKIALFTSEQSGSEVSPIKWETK
jgi:hypothetical protein